MLRRRGAAPVTEVPRPDRVAARVRHVRRGVGELDLPLAERDPREVPPRHGTQAGVGVGEGAGVGLGAGVGVGVALGSGVGVGEGVGVGTGVGVGVASVPAIAGPVRIWATAVRSKVTFWPPKKTDIIGVIKAKWPVTVTVTVLPRPAAHEAGLQVRSTSAGSIVTKPPAASLTTRHMTLFVSGSQAVPPWKASGSSASTAAVSAPSRAAFSTVICA